MTSRWSSFVLVLYLGLLAVANAGAKGLDATQPGRSTEPSTLSPPANDRCDGAIVIPCGNINLSGNTDQATNDYTFADTVHSCTGFSAGGKDVVFRLNVGPGDSLWIDYRSRVDGSIYLITDCSDVDGSCVIGADLTSLANEIESIRYKFFTGGTYYLILDSYGLNSSGLWTAVGQLVCGSSTPPPNDLCETAIPIPCGTFSLSGSTQFAHDYYGPLAAGSSCTGQLAQGHDVAYKLTITAGDSIAVDYTSTTNGSVYIVADCADVDTTCVIGADLVGSGQTEILRYRFSFSGVYYLVLDSRAAGSFGTWTASGNLVCQNPPPVNDRCEGALAAPCLDFNWSGNTHFGINDYFFPAGLSCTGYPTDGKDVVYKFDVHAGDNVVVNYTSTLADGSMYLVTDCADVLGTCVAGVDDGVTGDPETLHYIFPTTGIYYLILDSVDPNTWSAWTANGHLYCLLAGVGDGPRVPRLSLRGIQPNPFQGKTNLAFSVPARARTTLRIFDLQGRVTRTLVDRELDAGEHRVVWDGLNDLGQHVGAGVYFVRLSNQRSDVVRSLVFVR